MRREAKLVSYSDTIRTWIEESGLDDDVIARRSRLKKNVIARLREGASGVTVDRFLVGVLHSALSRTSEELPV